MTVFTPEQVQEMKIDRVERYKRLNEFIEKGQVLFAGSSLMEQFPINELLLNYELPYKVYNRGVSGFTTIELLENIEPCILDLEPKVLFLNIGTNDLNGETYDIDGLYQNFSKIISIIKDKLPDTSIYLMAYYPVKEEILQQKTTPIRYRTNKRIDEANEKVVQRIANENNLHYIDVNDGLKDKNGEQIEAFTVDGVHMYANGYMEVLKHLLPILESIKL